MAMQSTIYICEGVRLDNRYLHTLHFASRAKQEEYFAGKVVHTFSAYSYLRKNWDLQVAASMETAWRWNYLFFRNGTGRYMYYFITDVDYVGNNQVKLSLEMDVMQTYYFDFTIGKSFVERTHAATDTAGANTIPEGLETGEYVVNGKDKYAPLTFGRDWVVGATVDLSYSAAFDVEDTKFPDVEGEIYNGIYSGIRYFVYTSGAAVSEVIALCAEKGQAEAIQCIFAAPRGFISTTAADINHKATRVSMSSAASIKEWNDAEYGDNTQPALTKPTKLDGYTPRNKKLLTYPFTYMLMSNNSGGAATYRYEDFEDNPNFDVYYSVTPGGSLRLVPLYYKGENVNNEEGLVGGKFPIGGWVSDIYTNWLTQNAVNTKIQLFAGGTGTVSGAAGGAIGGYAVAGVPGAIGGAIMGAVGGLTSIASTLAEKEKQSLIPNQASGNTNCGDVTFSSGHLTFTAYTMTIKAEYAKIIDDYFDMFGYAVNRVITPSRQVRKAWTYLKTRGANVFGNVCEKDRVQIANILDNGITFWNGVEPGNYDTDNTL